MDRKEYSMTDVAPTVAAVLGVRVPAGAVGRPVPEIVADLAGVRKVAVLAPDALGFFAWSIWNAEMPWLRARHEERSILLRSVMPSITPVNFATMVSGTGPEGSGIRQRTDAFACETLFDTVRAAGGRSAAVGLDQYTGTALLGRYADICGNAGDGTDDDIAEEIVAIAGRDGPAFLIAQLGRVDDVFHRYGPSSPEVVPMLRGTDARLKRLAERLCPLGYGIVFLADHGQHDVAGAAENEMHGSHGTDRDEDCLVPCTWTKGT